MKSLYSKQLNFSKDRIKFAWEQVVEIAKKVARYVLIGVGIGAFIHNWIPEDFIVKVLGDNNPFDVIWLPLQAFRCMLTFSVQFRLQKPYLQKAHCSVSFCPL